VGEDVSQNSSNTCRSHAGAVVGVISRSNNNLHRSCRNLLSATAA
jgi:hypothetical protein